jgi:hypothetical protein
MEIKEGENVESIWKVRVIRFCQKNLGGRVKFYFRFVGKNVFKNSIFTAMFYFIRQKNVRWVQKDYLSRGRGKP